METASTLPKSFIFRRLHSLTGVFLTLFLIEHLLVNSQAALLFGEDGKGFVAGVNAIHDLPYLPFVEIFLLGVPILLHMSWGVCYLFTSRQNYYGSDPSRPILSEYPRNRAYTWQRMTSWILLFGIIAHVVHMRFLEYPASASVATITSYMVPLKKDEGLDTLAARLGFLIYTPQMISELKQKAAEAIPSPQNSTNPVWIQQQIEEKNWLAAVEKNKLKPGEVLAVATSFGMAELLIVRETFKMPLMIALYTIFVLSACFHGFNGLWTFMISWGVTLTALSQRIMLGFAYGLMALVAFWGLAAIWGTYWINLKH